MLCYLFAQKAAGKEIPGVRKILSVLMCGLAALMVALPASAGNVDQAVAALKHASVYIAPGSEAAGPDTLATLKGQLTPGDNIALVVLPASDLTDTTAAALAARIDAATGRRLIIGLVVGDQVAAASGLLPQNKADDLMNSAINVSSGNPIATLASFVQYVHQWQVANPSQPASKPAKKGGGTSFLLVMFLVGGAMGILLLIALLKTGGSHANEPGMGHLKFRSPVKDDLESLSKLRDQVTDQQMRRTLTQICKDTEQYFDRFSRTPEDDAGIFRTSLKTLRDVVTKYVEIQNDDPRYYDDAVGAMNSAKQTAADFSEYVLKNIKRGSDAQLTEFRVNTDILSAQRYR